MERTYRVIVRGRFANLSDDDRSTLLANMELLPPGFTEEGTIHYGPSLDFFTFRYVVRVSNDNPADSDVEAALTAEEKATATLAALGVEYHDLAVSGVTSMDDMKVHRRGR